MSVREFAAAELFLLSTAAAPFVFIGWRFPRAKPRRSASGRRRRHSSDSLVLALLGVKMVARAIWPVFCVGALFGLGFTLLQGGMEWLSMHKAGTEQPPGESSADHWAHMAGAVVFLLCYAAACLAACLLALLQLAQAVPLYWATTVMLKGVDAKRSGSLVRFRLRQLSSLPGTFVVTVAGAYLGSYFGASFGDDQPHRMMFNSIVVEVGFAFWAVVFGAGMVFAESLESDLKSLDKQARVGAIQARVTQMYREESSRMPLKPFVPTAKTEAALLRFAESPAISGPITLFLVAAGIGAVLVYLWAFFR